MKRKDIIYQNRKMLLSAPIQLCTDKVNKCILSCTTEVQLKSAYKMMRNYRRLLLHHFPNSFDDVNRIYTSFYHEYVAKLSELTLNT